MSFLSLLAAALIGNHLNGVPDEVPGYTPPPGSIVIITDGPHFSRDQLRGMVEFILVSPEQIEQAIAACNIWYVMEYPDHFTPDEVLDAVVAHFAR